VLALVELDQQIEFFGEQRVVILQRIAEQREGFDEGAAPGHDLGPAAGQIVERGKLLVDADRIVGGQDRDRARQADRIGAQRRCGQRHRRRGHRIVGTVMLAQPEEVEAELVGELDLLDEVLQPLLRADDLAGDRVLADVAECIEAEFHCRTLPLDCGGVRVARGVAPVAQTRKAVNSLSTASVYRPSTSAQ
jgi:hypothetical protein